MTTPHPDGGTLSEYVDGGLAPAAQAEISVHLAACVECRSMVDGLRTVSSAARALPPLDAPRGVWPRIERELRPRRRAAVWSWLAAAAAIVLATLAGFKIADVRHQRAAGVSLASTEAPTAESVEADLMHAEQFYQKAITGLEQIANDGKGSLDPQTASTLEKSLKVVDQAIGESRAALRAQPASQPAQASLLESFKSKVSLLQDTVALINEMRRTGLTQKGS